MSEYGYCEHCTTEPKQVARFFTKETGWACEDCIREGKETDTASVPTVEKSRSEIINEKLKAMGRRQRRKLIRKMNKLEARKR